MTKHTMAETAPHRAAQGRRMPRYSARVVAPCVLALAAAPWALSAQAAKPAQEEEIALPDVTTVVSGDTLTAGKDAVPDYSAVLPTEDTGKIALPTLEKAQPPASAPSAASAQPGSASSGAERNVYAEGQLGGGFPFLFLGDFAVYRATGAAPFSITFSHKSNEHFADNKAGDGFFSRNTAVGAEQALVTERSRHAFRASYDTADYGLQSLSTPFFDMVSHTVSVAESSRFALGTGWNVNFGVDASWYNRYGGSTGSDDLFHDENGGGITVYDSHGEPLLFDLKGVRASTTTLDVTPHAGFGWQNDALAAGFDARYTLQGNLDDGDNLYAYSGSRYRNATHRGSFGIFGSWRTTYVTLRGDFAAVVGSALGKPKVVLPFSLGADFRIPLAGGGNAAAGDGALEADGSSAAAGTAVAGAAPADGRGITLSVAGGLDSRQATVRELERSYRFAYAAALPAETSDWFGTAAVSVPVPVAAVEAFTVTGAATYRRTAFDNGVWTADYTGSRDDAGLYWLLPDDRSDLESTLGVSMDVRGIHYSAGWEAHWLDVPALCDRHALSLAASYEGARFSASARIAEALGADSDKVPQLDARAAVRASPTLRLALVLTDVVKLLSNTTRSFAHSDYASESGSAALVVQFQF